MEQLDELIFNTTESLRNNKNQPNGDTTYASINKDLTSDTMKNLKNN